MRALDPGYTWDMKLPGFGVYRGTYRTTFVTIRNGKRSKLGLYPYMSLAEARKAAVLALHAPQTLKTSPGTTEAVESYLRAIDLKSSSLKEKERLLRKHFLSKHTAPLHTITTRDVTAILDNLRATPSEALHVYRALKAFFNWAVSRDMIEQSPMGKLQPPSRDKARERVLSHDELRSIYKALEHVDVHFATAVVLLLFTGQRLGQIANLSTEHIDFDKQTITWPAALMKGNEQHTIPFGKTVKGIIEEAREQPGRLFSGSAFLTAIVQLHCYGSERHCSVFILTLKRGGRLLLSSLCFVC